MNVRIFHNPNCGTSRNTLALIRNAGVEPTIVEYLQHPPPRAELVALLERMGARPRDVLRRKGTPYAELGLDSDRWSDDQLVDLMLQHPLLIERPIVETPWGVRLCRPSEAVLDILPLPQRAPFAKEDGEIVIDASGRRARPIVMQIASDAPFPVTPETPLLERTLPLDGARILELGCGRAQLTRAIATAGRDRSLVALEVDETQHALNLQIADLPNVRFALGGAEAIPADDASFDVVLLFKSLHHVPAAAMPRALQEIRRVLKPGGLAWISEPVFAGAFNDVIRVFHDEQRVRELAFGAVRDAVAAGTLELVSETFFAAPVEFADYAEFERAVIGVTHTRHRLSPAQEAETRARFARHADASGAARFEQPIRVDLLRRAA